MQGDIRYRRPASSRRRKTRAQQVQCRRFALAVCLLVLIVVATAGASYASRADAAVNSPVAGSVHGSTTIVDPAASLVSATYTARLKDDSQASGGPEALLKLEYDAGTRSVFYSLEMTSPLPNPSIAAICVGAPGQSGNTIFTIFAGPTISGRFSGVLAKGEIAPADLVGPMQGRDLTDLILLVKEGGAYATVGTVGTPVDAIRGQIE